jgi:hypothetical protein
MAEVKACYLKCNYVLIHQMSWEERVINLLIHIFSHIVAMSVHVWFGAILKFLLQFLKRQNPLKSCFISENS